MYKIKFVKSCKFELKGVKLKGLVGSFMEIKDLEKIQFLIDDGFAEIVEQPKKQQTKKNHKKK